MLGDGGDDEHDHLMQVLNHGEKMDKMEKGAILQVKVRYINRVLHLPDKVQWNS